MTEPPTADDRDPPSEEIARSARGWNGIQLAVLAFVGLCGVLSEADARHPRWLQVTAGLLALTALFVACLAVFLVASVAWPLSRRQTPAAAENDTGSPDVVPSRRARRRLQMGTALTYLAVVVMALAASANWWPVSEADGADSSSETAQVRITDTQGNAACGALTDGPRGTIQLLTDRGTVELSLDGLASVGPAIDC